MHATHQVTYPVLIVQPHRNDEVSIVGEGQLSDATPVARSQDLLVNFNILTTQKYFLCH